MNSTTKLVDTCPHVNSDNITFILGGKPVYKDQCEKCYIDQVIKYLLIFSKVIKVLIFV